MQYPEGHREQHFGDERTVRFTGFALHRAGIVQSQVQLAVGSHVLCCAPFKISTSRGVFLAVLRPEEADLFQGLQGRSCLATLAFGGGVGSFSIRLQGSLEGITVPSAWSDRCLLDVALPTCLEDLMQVLGPQLTPATGLREAG